MNDEPTETRDDEAPSLRQQVYDDLRYRLLTGKIVPEVGISTRGIAQELGVSQMPVREALSRLAAEGAVAIRSKRAIMVPPMTRARYAELYKCRLLLEPTAAGEALPHIDAARLRELKTTDKQIDAALAGGDVNGYMESNYRFHSLIYNTGATPLLNRMIDMLWMQFGPFMRGVYGRFGTANLVDHHQRALEAIARKDKDSLIEAIKEDIGDGMELMQDAEWES